MHVSLNGMDRAAGTIPHNKGPGKMNCGASGRGADIACRSDAEGVITGGDMQGQCGSRCTQD